MAIIIHGEIYAKFTNLILILSFIIKSFVIDFKIEG